MSIGVWNVNINVAEGIPAIRVMVMVRVRVRINVDEGIPTKVLLKNILVFENAGGEVEDELGTMRLPDV